MTAPSGDNDTFAAELEATYDLLVHAAYAVTTHDMHLCVALKYGAVWESDAADLPPELAAWWIEREAAFRLAWALGFDTDDRDDHRIPAVLCFIAGEPAATQQALLCEAAATLQPHDHDI